ncbi:MAG: cyclodeaminase/cyclohydrolase family protein [Euryarchaeota archaeon]|jgi:formiminotetrahydrofolate cyclodeaminase|nr:cyclodeaminase/cyclohydrolase family protein [Euryarchaeota archaeon]MBT4925185.1 cyclodeaminase/cyclohydrolase family protein [Euryarchaeota archaeon]MBT5736683.1 cyclodeaminase/cyclohydrolase family protein [Euryarchaeota archaeon]MBT7460014.1 cyclodeaminase/cyclohydrolase family protein [Euryarchaeota archaeon]
MDWMDMSLRDFQSALASSSPTPGGGTASAIALGQAAALTCMVADLTIGKEKWKDGWGCAEKAQSVAISIFTKSGSLAKEDSDSFELVMDCFKMPKSNDEEKQQRRDAIRSATLHAAEVPYETAKLAFELLEVLPELAKKGNGNAVSDVGVASLLASAAVKGALFNVDINLGSLPEDMVGELSENSKQLLEKSRLLSKESIQIVRERLV